MIHLLVLLISLRWHFHFVTQLLLILKRILLRKDCKLSIVLHNFITKENLVNDFVIWSGMSKEVVIHFRSSSGIDSDELTSLLVFKNCLFDVLFVLKVGSLFHWLKKLRVFYGIFVDELFDVVLDLNTSVCAIYFRVYHAIW